MRIKVWVSCNSDRHSGPYRLLDTIERPEPVSSGDFTGYGAVISILPSIPPFAEDADQSVLVELEPANLLGPAPEGVLDTAPVSYQKFSLLPVQVQLNRFLEPHAISESRMILPDEGLSIEDVSPLRGPDTFSTWKRGCFLSKRNIDELESLRYALVHRYRASSSRDGASDGYSRELVSLANACLSLIRPTRKSRAGIISGLINDDGTIDPQGFNLIDPVDVPKIQTLFSVRTHDVDLMHELLPQFLDLYHKDSAGRLKDDYEPIRMAVQLYEQGYANSYWKARHILWWSAIEALYGNAEDSIMARIYSFFGSRNIVEGYDRSIYEPGDIPSVYAWTSNGNHTLGEVLPLIYEVRNSAAHGQKVADPHFIPISHPFQNSTPLVDVLAEAATFVIRKTITEILKQGLTEHFKDREARERFWLYEYSLDNRQSKKRLYELKQVRPTKSA
jgi:hypothetical protein